MLVRVAFRLSLVGLLLLAADARSCFVHGDDSDKRWLIRSQQCGCQDSDPGDDGTSYNGKDSADQKAPEMESIVFVACHPFSARQDEPLRLDSHKQQPVDDKPIDQIEEEDHNEQGQEGLPES